VFVSLEGILCIAMAQEWILREYLGEELAGVYITNTPRLLREAIKFQSYCISK